MKTFFVISSFLLLTSFQIKWKTIDTERFSIDVPRDWIYVKEQGEDSFIGKIKTKQHTTFSFDCSTSGYANSLIPTEQEYLKSNRWDNGYFYKPGVTYTSDFNVHAARSQLMKEKGITDSSLVAVETDPRYQTSRRLHKASTKEKGIYPKADYIADLTYQGKTVTVSIEIPLAVKMHNIQVDSDAHYVYKTIWPKIASKGLTGTYIYSRTSSFNFQLSGYNLSEADQKLALQAFKTIKFKR